MSIPAISAAFAESQAMGGDFLVLLALADYANEDGLAWPSVPTLAKKARLSERSVRRALRALESLGEIEVKQYAGVNGTHLYHLTNCPGRSSCQADKYDREGRSNCPPIRHKNPSKKRKRVPPDKLSGADKMTGGYEPIAPQRVVELWNAIPGIQRCLTLGPTIAQALKCRLKEHVSIEWWETYFEKIAASDFLCGRRGGSFRASLSWVLAPSNRDKILAGNYDDAQPASSNCRPPVCPWKPNNNGNRRLQACGRPIAPGEKLCPEHAAEQQRIAAAVNQISS